MCLGGFEYHPGTSPVGELTQLNPASSMDVLCPRYTSQKETLHLAKYGSLKSLKLEKADSITTLMVKGFRSIHQKLLRKKERKEMNTHSIFSSSHKKLYILSNIFIPESMFCQM